MWQPDWPTISAVLRFTLPPCHVIGTFLELGYYARVTAPRTNRALYTLELTYQGDPCGQVVLQSSQMKTYYDSFVLCKSNHNTYIIPHTVMKSRYTNVKYHCEISWYFSVYCWPQSLRNYKEEAKIKPSEKALAMPGQSCFLTVPSHNWNQNWKFCGIPCSSIFLRVHVMLLTN